MTYARANLLKKIAVNIALGVFFVIAVLGIGVMTVLLTFTALWVWTYYPAWAVVLAPALLFILLYAIGADLRNDYQTK